MKIAVTSASGQLGAAIINQLKQELGTDHVIGIARTPEKAQHLGVEIRKGDYNSRDDFQQALTDVNRVVILSGNDYPDNRIGQHRNIIEAAKINQLDRIVYTSIMGDPAKTTFSPIIKSNRQTEEDIRTSGLDWAIGRNGIYLEPDIEAIDSYIAEGEIVNCAGDGKCGYTSRAELGTAYAKMAIETAHSGQTYNLTGPAITQSELCQFLNETYQTNLSFRSVEVESYAQQRTEQLGDFLGPIISGIYEGISNGAFEGPSHYENAAGRPHQTVPQMIQNIRKDLSE